MVAACRADLARGSEGKLLWLTGRLTALNSRMLVGCQGKGDGVRASSVVWVVDGERLSLAQICVPTTVQTASEPSVGEVSLPLGRVFVRSGGSKSRLGRRYMFPEVSQVFSRFCRHRPPPPTEYRGGLSPFCVQESPTESPEG